MTDQEWQKHQLEDAEAIEALMDEHAAKLADQLIDEPDNDRLADRLEASLEVRDAMRVRIANAQVGWLK